MSDVKVAHDGLHPKLKGSLLGAAAGGVVGTIADVVLAHVAAIVTIPDTYQAILYAGVVFLLTKVGHLVFGYLSKWDDRVATDIGGVVGRVEHAIDSRKVADDVSARVVEVLEGKFSEYEGHASQVLFGDQDVTDSVTTTVPEPSTAPEPAAEASNEQTLAPSPSVDEPDDPEDDSDIVIP